MEIRPEAKALAAEYSAKIQSVSNAYNEQILVLYKEYQEKHQCLMRTIEGQGDTAGSSLDASPTASPLPT